MNSISFRARTIAALLATSCVVASAVAQAPAPAATITSIDAKTGVVTGKINASGQQFQFTLNDRAQLPQLRTGQGVYVNLKTNQISLDGKTIAGTVVSRVPSNSGSGSGPKPIAPPNSTGSLPSGSGTGGTSPPSGSGAGSGNGKQLPGAQNSVAWPPPQSNLCRDSNGNKISSQGIDLLPALITAVVVTPTQTVAQKTTAISTSLGKPRGSGQQQPGPYPRFALENCGDTAATTPFVVDVYVNGTRADTIKIENPVQPQSAIAVTSSLANLNAAKTCSVVAVRVVVDSEDVIQDSNRANNDQTAQVTPPCPDLAVTGIWRHWLDNLHTQFEIRYKVANLGSAPLPHAVTIHAWGGPNPGIPPDLPIAWFDTLASLTPGEERTLQIHQAFWKGETVGLTIAVDPDNTIAEPNKNNNSMSGNY